MNHNFEGTAPTGASAENTETENTSEVDLREYQLVGGGGENLVFVNKDKTQVVKVNYFTISDVKTNPEKAIKDVERRNQDVDLLRKYFGSKGSIDHTLHPQGKAYRLSRVVLSKEQLTQGLAKIGAEVTPDNEEKLGIESDTNGDISIEAIVSSQVYLPLDQLETNSFSFESYNPDREQEILSDFSVDFTCRNGNRVEHIDKLRNLYPSLAPLLDQPTLQLALHDFVQSLIRFIKETGRSIDFEGDGNIFFVKNLEQDESTFVLMDVLQAEPKDYFESKNTFDRKRNGEIGSESNIDEIVVPELYQFYGLNLLASVLQIDNRIDSFNSQKHNKVTDENEFQEYVSGVVKMRSKKN